MMDDLLLNGIITGKLIVTGGCFANVRGIVKGDILVERGGKLELYGTASGGVTNDGGIVEIFGRVSGGLIKLSGHTVVHNEAVIE